MSIAQLQENLGGLIQSANFRLERAHTTEHYRQYRLADRRSTQQKRQRSLLNHSLFN